MCIQSYVAMLLYALQCLMLMEILFDADGLSQLKGNVVICASTLAFQLHLTRLVILHLMLFNQ